MRYDIEIAFMQILLSKNGSKYYYLFDKMKPEFFKNIGVRKVFVCASECVRQKIFPDPVIVAEKTQEYELITEIMLDDTLSVQCEKYAEMIFNAFIDDLLKNTKTKDGLKKINKYQDEFGYFNSNFVSLGDETTKLKEEYEVPSNTLYSLYDKIDSAVGSFRGGDYIVFGAGTGVGKTMFALNLTQKVCFQDKKILYVSLEMPLTQLQNRFICMCQGLNALKYRSHGFNMVELEKYNAGAESLKEWKVDVLTEPRLTSEKLRYYIKQSRPDFVVIDYLGLMQCQGNTPYERMTKLSNEIKIIAQEFNIVILALVQLNRNNKERQNKRPVLSDIRESGAIEQDADFVFFGYRDEEKPNELEVIIAKNRHGISNLWTKLKINLSTQKIE